MKDEFNKLCTLMDEVYQGTPWYGTSVKRILSDLTEDDAGLKAGESHTVIELVLHMVAWKNYVIEILGGNTAYTVSDELNFPKGTSLKTAINELESTHRKMMEIVSGFDVNTFDEIIPDRKYRYFDLLHGIIHHDVYHAGQISLLKKKK